jgi:hypothetical protein
LGNEAILEEDLAVIDCGICHDGGTGPDIAIWNNVSKGYDAVATADELCQKCHGPAWGGFEAATSPSDKAGDKGTATDGTATSLTETGQDFLTTVAVGMTVFNETDNSLATVTAVNDDESITTTALIGRATRPESKIVTELTWETDDKYHIYQGPLIPGGTLSGTSHQIVVGGSAHPNEIGIAAADRGPSSCISCHDTHSLEASCTDCHTDLNTASNAMKVGHDARMAKVTCVGCHSADPVQTALGWVDDEAREVFTVGTMAVPRGATEPVFAAGSTHLVNRSAKACTDCHTPDNAWGISVIEAKKPSGRPF